jgi:hypothetical protein
VEPLDGAAVEKVISSMYATPPEVIERVRRATSLGSSK